MQVGCIKNLYFGYTFYLVDDSRLYVCHQNSTAKKPAVRLVFYSTYFVTVAFLIAADNRDFLRSAVLPLIIPRLAALSMAL